MAGLVPAIHVVLAARQTWMPGTRCATCHDLERVTIVKRYRRDWPPIVANMVARGAVATPAEAHAISATSWRSSAATDGSVILR